MGDDFVQHALRIDWKHDDLHLSGWVATPEFTRSQNDLNYCYINGRMVRDKVITHAIRQAYAEHLHTEQYPTFVLLSTSTHMMSMSTCIQQNTKFVSIKRV